MLRTQLRRTTLEDSVFAPRHRLPPTLARLTILNSPAEYYQDRLSRLEREALQLQDRDRWFSLARGGTFSIAAFLLFLGWTRIGIPGYVAGGLCLVGLVVLIFHHDRVQQHLKMVIARTDLNRQQVARRERNWSAVPLSEVEVPTAHRPLARDLDLFGHASLWQLLNQAHTARGNVTLRDWLLEPSLPAEVGAREAAVKRLASLCLFREDVVFNARFLNARANGPQEFVEWAEGPRWLGRRPILRWAVRALALAMLVLPPGIYLGWVPPETVLLLLVLLAVNVAINAVWTGSIHELFNRIDAGEHDMEHYTALFRLVAQLPDDGGGKLAELKRAMSGGGVDFERALVQLRRAMALANGRRSALFGVPYVLAEILWFWDFHVLYLLERWQSRCGHVVRHWIQAVAELEALVSLATLAHDHPQWTYAEVDPATNRVLADAVGHPLLPPDGCVRNDVSVGPAGRFLLVTGSNMSGKSTLLRALGVNAVLAQAGGPVCAARFQMPPLELATSMRITDSLHQGVSFFLAELWRLKEIVDRANQLNQDPGGRRLCYLLDEILQGTNSAERHVAVTRVIEFLVRSRAIGAVSTHDLALASEQRLTTHADVVHLRETIQSGPTGEEMSFDYKLHPGISSTTNALKLLKMVGLGEDCFPWNRD